MTPTLTDDAVLAPVGRFVASERLDVWKADAITDAGLAHLAALARLQSVDLAETGTTPAGEANLRRALAGLTYLSPSTRAYALAPKATRARPAPVGGPGNRAAAAGGGAAVAVGGGRVDRPGIVTKGEIVGDSIGKRSAVLDRLRDRSRPVLVFGPGPDDDRVRRQRHSWVGALPEAGIKDRDLVVVEAFEAGEGTIAAAPLPADEAKELREALGIAAGSFAVLLVGRDGGVKDRWDDPVAPHEIFGKVDGMPMREREVQARGGGSE